MSLLAGAVLLAASAGLARLPALRGVYTGSFLGTFSLAALSYLVAVLRIRQDRLSLGWIWGIAIAGRALLLLAEPSLSDDVYRYLWDGQLLLRSVNPYSYPVNAPTLDAFATPLRALVNHAWMASPYLPAAQLYFGGITFLAPGSVKAFQIAAVILDLLTGWLLLDLLKLAGRRRQSVLLYLWHPLVMVEFAGSAHLDALMLLLVMAAFWLVVRARQSSHAAPWLSGSVVLLAAATLTKGIPALLAPLFFRRWKWRHFLLYGLLVLIPLLVFASGAGWGLSGSLDGTGLFGALRIYQTTWNFNSSVYHWLETALSGYRTAGGVPGDAPGAGIIPALRTLMATLTGLAALAAGWLAWRAEEHTVENKCTTEDQILSWLRLATLPIGAYLLFTHTLHPWYPLLVVPFLPFFIPAESKASPKHWWAWAWLSLSLTSAFSYLTYLDLTQPRELSLTRWLEYPLFYGLLVIALLAAARGGCKARRQRHPE